MTNTRWVICKRGTGSATRRTVWSHRIVTNNKINIILQMHSILFRAVTFYLQAHMLSPTYASVVLTMDVCMTLIIMMVGSTTRYSMTVSVAEKNNNCSAPHRLSFAIQHYSVNYKWFKVTEKYQWLLKGSHGNIEKRFWVENSWYSFIIRGWERKLGA